MRPIIQKSLVRVISQIAAQKVLDWPTLLGRVAALPWAIGEAPWISVFNTANNKIVNAKENVKLLDDLLYAHIAASSKQSIIKVRKQFKEIRGISYPVSEQQLQQNLTPHTESRSVLPDVIPVVEIEPESIEAQE
jgi:DNA sulfur modification protein DndB